MSFCEHCGEITLAIACARCGGRASLTQKAPSKPRFGQGSSGGPSRQGSASIGEPSSGERNIKSSLETQLSQAPDSAPPLASSSSSHKPDSSVFGPRIRSRPNSQTQPTNPTIAQSELLLKLSRARTRSELSLRDLRQLTEVDDTRDGAIDNSYTTRHDSSKRSASTSPSRKWDAARALDATKSPPSPSRPTVQFFEDTASSSTAVVRKVFSAFDLSKSVNRDSKFGTRRNACYSPAAA